MKDAQGREIRYLRVSVTDRCKRCTVCRCIECVEHKDILSFEEIRQIAVCGAGLGITKIRLTGGEPLARKGCPELIRMLKKIPGIEKIAMTTNGTLVRAILPELVEAGLMRDQHQPGYTGSGTFAATTG
ncbi:MAG: radical SAM protein [Lachnospiraceae bacterium]